MKKLIYLTLIISVFYACQKDDCNKKDIYHNVSDEGKSMLPYSGFDTLTYLRTNIGDTHTFIGTGKKTTYDVQSEKADCGNTLYFEKYYYTYKCNNYNDLVIGQYTNNNISCFTNIDFNNQNFNGDVDFNDSKTDLDSIILSNNKVYYKVERIPNFNPTPTTYRAYFNKQYGCIKMVFTNGDTWELLSFKK
jgi:hypothetical protein